MPVSCPDSGIPKFRHKPGRNQNETRKGQGHIGVVRTNKRQESTEISWIRELLSEVYQEVFKQTCPDN